MVGNVSLFEIDAINAVCSIGYRVAPWARRRGVATGAVRMVSVWAFTTLGLERIQLYHAVENAGSCGVATAAGFALEGTLRSAHRYADGERHDEHLHARLPRDP
jgi:RimJ/RimL family protein N-acetyltransferase